MPNRASTLLLTRRDILEVMHPEDYLDAVETAFRLAGEGRVDAAPVVDVPGDGGAFHIKAAGTRGSKRYVAVKVNGNFAENGRRFGLPTIQGVIVLADGENGSPLALLDSIEITSARTAAATALAARYLARPESAVLTLCGCGAQAAAQIQALRRVLPLKQVFTFDLDPERARRAASLAATEPGIEAAPVSNLQDAARKSDVIVTCTTSRKPFLADDDVPRGAFVAAVGADAHDKRELHSDLLSRAKLVVDVLEQCAAIGELHHALQEGFLSREGVHAELGDLVRGAKPGRTDPSERIVFDSTGTAIQDVASAILAYERARERGIGRSFELSA
ncbi:MAG: ornithine cyclodeaminase family protein [Vicinamibacteria bacterium]